MQLRQPDSTRWTHCKYAACSHWQKLWQQLQHSCSEADDVMTLCMDMLCLALSTDAP